MSDPMLTMYLLSIYFFGILTTSSAVAKLVYPNDSPAASHKILSILSKLTKNKIFIVSEIAVGIAIVAFSSWSVHIVLATGLFLIIASGVSLLFVFPNTPCNCFGATAASESKALHVVLLVVALIALLTIFYASNSPMIQRFSILEIVLMSIGFLLVGGLFVHGIISQKVQKAIEEAEEVEEDYGHFSPDTLLGFRNGQEVSLADVAEANKPLFLVGVDSLCPQCKKLVPDVISFAKGFGDQLPIVLIVSDEDYVNVDDDLRLQIIVDPKRQFMVTQKLQGMPFAYLIYDKTLEIMAPPSLGNEAVRMLFAVMLNARITE